MLDPISGPIHQVLDLFAADLAEGEVRRRRSRSPDASSRAGHGGRRCGDPRGSRAGGGANRLAREAGDVALEGTARLAYARVYAEDDAALADRIDAIPLVRGARRLAKAQAGGGFDARRRYRGAAPARTPEERGSEWCAPGDEYFADVRSSLPFRLKLRRVGALGKRGGLVRLAALAPRSQQSLRGGEDHARHRLGTEGSAHRVRQDAAGQEHLRFPRDRRVRIPPRLVAPRRREGVSGSLT